MGEGEFPKVDGDILFASEVNDFGLLSTETETEDTSTYSINSPANWTQKTTFTLSVPNKAKIVGVKIEFEYQRTNTGAVNFSAGVGVRINPKDNWTNSKSGVTAATTAYFSIFSRTMNGNDGSFVSSGDIYISLPDVGDYDDAAQERTLSIAMAMDSNLSTEVLSIKNINVTTYYLHLEH